MDSRFCFFQIRLPEDVRVVPRLPQERTENIKIVCYNPSSLRIVDSTVEPTLLTVAAVCMLLKNNSENKAGLVNSLNVKKLSQSCN